MQVVLSFCVLTIGGLIYVVYRDKSLLMFDWFHSFGIDDDIDDVRCFVQTYGVYGWVKNSLPDGLWLFSYMFIVDAIWNGERLYSAYIFLWGLPFFAVLSEVLQYFNFFYGVYDLLDLISYIFAILLFVVFKFIK